VARRVKEKHLFVTTDKTPDSILTIVGQAVGVEPALLQRDIPGRFEIVWEGDLVLDVRTDVAGQPVSKFRNFMIDVKRTIISPVKTIPKIEVKISPDDALTLYRAVDPGMYTLLYTRNNGK